MLHRSSLFAVLACSLLGPQARADDDPAREKDFLTGTRQITFEGRRAGEGYFSADGSRLVFQSERRADNPFFQIYVLDFETGDITPVSPGHGKTTCSWIHPTANRVLFASTHDDPQARAKQKQELDFRASGKQKRYSWDYDEHYDIYDRDMASGTMRNLTHARGYDAEGSWSPDGSLIAFASNRHAYTDQLSTEDREAFEFDLSLLMDLYIMSADGTKVRRLTTTRGYDGGPFFSPDGRRLCWRRFSENGAIAEIFTMNIDGTDERQLTRLGAMSWAPYFHPSSKYLIFTTNRHGFDNFELYLVDAAGTKEPVRVTSTPGFDGLASFSPDGTRLTWTTNRTSDKTSQIFLAEWDHAAALRALGLDGQSAAPTVATTLPATAQEIRAEDARTHVEILASERFRGRKTGTKGERLATEYVAAQFKRFGLEPAGDDGTYYQYFDFTAGIELATDNAVTLIEDDEKRTAFDLNTDWRPLGFSQSGPVPASEVAFVGYGLVAPAHDAIKAFDSYGDLEVKGKWVMVLRNLPDDITPEVRQHWHRHGQLRYKAMIARDRGATGLIVVSGPKSKVRNQLITLNKDASLAGSSIAAISMSDAAADKVLANRHKTLEDLQNELDDGTFVPGFTVHNVKLAASIDIRKVTDRGRNVVARLPAGAGRSDTRAVVVGAHIDHLGVGHSESSLARDDERSGIHYGADDNASGIAGMLEIAERLQHLVNHGSLQLKRDVVFAGWSGEEMGLLGSEHYVQQLLDANGQDLTRAVLANLNMDMIGRFNKAVVINGTGSSSIWPGELERRNAVVGLPISAQPDAYLPTDATSFYVKGVPVLSAFTGAHADYHTPRDTPDKLDYDNLARVAKLFALITRGLATRDTAPDYIAMKQAEKLRPRSGLRVYLGTIPDYADIGRPGLKLSGVTAGAPADVAGLKGDDIIVELAGRKIENIYDYVYAIDALKIGEEVDVVVERGGTEVRLKITPGSRE